MTPADLRARLEAAGWTVVDLPGHHAMEWTAIHVDTCVTLRHEGTVSAWTRGVLAACDVHVTGDAESVAATLRQLGVRL